MPLTCAGRTTRITWSIWDLIQVETPEGPVEYPVVQVWVDPAHPHAHRDPGLRAYLAKIGEVALVRTGAEGFVLVPPQHSEDGQWCEMRSNVRRTETVTEMRLIDKLAGVG